ncbi:MAG TPA: phosphate ABC transporter permease subunit PstC [Streptosporangiaceae bacterium]|nr:phosphate ABC transporter permease subunit PstC [Streptosporangiaceae bacterium]
MAATAPVTGPDGGAGTPLPRRVGGALRAAVRRGEVLRILGGVGALLPLAALLLILVALLFEAIPAIRINGLHFFYKSVWNEGTGYNAVIVNTGGVKHLSGADYGALPEIVGTLQTSLIALIVGVPISIGSALFIVERLPRQLANAIGVFLELLAGIPSVIIGLWGTLTFGPFISRDITPVIARNMPDVPVLNYFRGSTGNGQGLLTSGLVLAIMIIPIVAATSRDLIRQVPILPREGAIALGMSDAQCARRVTLPWVGSGIIGAVVLGLGRALGETMAVAMCCGFAVGAVASNIYTTMTTISATIVLDLDTAFLDGTGFAVRTLAELALVLMVITLAVNVAARWLVRRVSGTALPVGRGV